MRYKATVAYDGSGYHGWQKQINAHGLQSEIEAAFAAFSKTPVEITASGRTDAGVHAKGQVFHFDSNLNMKPENFMKALNARLPLDIRILKVEAVDEDFHARFSAKKKRYDYLITDNRLDPFAWKYKTVLFKKPDVQRMREAARFLEGTHDFTSFSSAKIHADKSRIKTIESITIEEKDGDIRLSFVGNGFLRYQVRMMSGALIACGNGEIKPEEIHQILEARDKEACRYNAPANGLYLMEVDYA